MKRLVRKFDEFVDEADLPIIGCMTLAALVLATAGRVAHFAFGSGPGEVLAMALAFTGAVLAGIALALIACKLPDETQKKGLWK